MKKYLSSVVSKFDTVKSGNAATGTTITVRSPTLGTKSTIYSDNGTTEKENPFIVDSNGNYEFYAPDGRYNIIQNEGLASELVLSDVSIFDVQDFISLNFKSTESLSLSDAPYAIGDTVNTFSFYEDGDGGGDKWRKIGEGETPSQLPAQRGNGTLTDAVGGVWEVILTNNRLFAQSLGVVVNSTDDQTDEIAACISHHIAKSCELVFPNGEYYWQGYSYTTTNYNVNISAPNRAIFKASEFFSPGGRMFDFYTQLFDASLTLDSDIDVGQNYIDVTDASGASAGQMIRIVGTEFWPYDNRGQFYKGETHLIESISGNRIFFTDYTRDAYTTGTIDNITTWNTNTCLLKNIEADMMDSEGSACFRIGQCLSPVFENLTSKKATTTGLWCIESWMPRARNIYAENIGNEVTQSGYGYQDRGCVGTDIVGLFTKGCRRSFDAHSNPNSSSSPARDYSVRNFRVYGGGAFFPDTSEISYGIGNHGSCENGSFSDGQIFDCQIGINHRGKGLSISNVDVFGQCNEPVKAYFGAGLIMDNVNYFVTDYPNKGGIAEIEDSNQGATYLVGFGIASTSDADYDWSMPTSITNCVGFGLKEALVYIERNTQKVRQMVVANNQGSIIGDNATYGDFLIARSLTTIADCRFENNLINNNTDRAVRLSSGNIGEYDLINKRYAVKFNNAFTCRIADDDYVRITGFSTYDNSRPIIAFTSDTAGKQIFEIRQNATTEVAEGNTTASNIDITDTPDSINGTFGTDGNWTMGLDGRGDLLIENRTGSLRNVRVALVV